MDNTKLIPSIINRVGKLESDSQNQTNGFDPSTYNMRAKEYFYEPFIFRGVANLISSTTAYSHNIYSTAFSISGTSPSYSYSDVGIGSTVVRKPALRVNGSSAGSMLAMYYGLNASSAAYTFTYGSNNIITYITTFFLDNYNSNRQINIGLGSFSQSSSILGGNGFIVRFAQDVNSGNAQYGQVASSVVTVENGNIGITANTLNTVKIIVNTQANTVSFYLNDTLLGTQTIVSMASKMLYPTYHLRAMSTAQLNATIMSIHNLYFGIEYL